MNLIRKISLLLILFLPVASPADMYVDRSIVIFEAGGQPRQDVKVSNTDEDVMYVQTEVFHVRNPGEESEDRVQVSNPKEIKLITTPSKLIVPAGGQKLIRIVSLDKVNDSESVYRINVTPIVPPLEEESSQLRIVVAYQVLVIVQPKDPKSTLEVARTGNHITFHNQGNTNILLSEGNQCDAVTDECQQLTSRRLYAGNTWELQLPFDAPVEYSIRSFDGIKKQIFP